MTPAALLLSGLLLVSFAPVAAADTWIVSLSPSSSTIAAGASQHYTAYASDLTNPWMSKYVTLEGIFTIRSPGSCAGVLGQSYVACTSTLAGDYYVQFLAVYGPSAAELHVTPAALDHLVLSPSSATIAAGASQAYTAEGFDVYSNSLGDLTSATTFTISGIGSCTGTSCTSAVGGDHTVTGTDGSATGTAVLHVNGATVAGATYVSLAPARILDTRNNTGLAGAFTSGSPRSLAVTGHGGVPSGAIAVTGTLTVTDQTSPGYAALTTVSTPVPTTSTLNFPLSDNRATGVTAPLGAGGVLWITYVGSAGGATTDLIFDVTGYFVQ